MGVEEGDGPRRKGGVCETDEGERSRDARWAREMMRIKDDEPRTVTSKADPHTHRHLLKRATVKRRVQLAKGVKPLIVRLHGDAQAVKRRPRLEGEKEEEG